MARLLTNEWSLHVHGHKTWFKSSFFVQRSRPKSFFQELNLMAHSFSAVIWKLFFEAKICCMCILFSVEKATQFPVRKKGTTNRRELPRSLIINQGICQTMLEGSLMPLVNHEGFASPYVLQQYCPPPSKAQRGINFQQLCYKHFQKRKDYNQPHDLRYA